MAAEFSGSVGSEVCWACEHPGVLHPLERRDDDLPLVLHSAPCIEDGCGCDDYDGIDHPERPSLAEAWVYRTDDGGMGLV